MNSNVGIVPFFKRGDIGGLTYLVTNNIVNYLIVIATLSGVLKWPDKVVFGYVIPGMSIGLFLGCCYYAWMGYRISKRDQRPDVTALPSGVSTTAMFVMLYGVIMPLSYAVEDPMVAWSAAMAACFLGGVIEFVGDIALLRASGLQILATPRGYLMDSPSVQEDKNLGMIACLHTPEQLRDEPKWISVISDFIFPIQSTASSTLSMDSR